MAKNVLSSAAIAGAALLLIVITIQPPCEAARILDEEDKEWMMIKKAAAAGQRDTLLLNSLQWRAVTPPRRNPGTNAAATLGNKNFAAVDCITISNSHAAVHPDSHHYTPAVAMAAALPRHNIQFGVAEDANHNASDN
ncbi:unnamed protein product [Cuscuta epithymum]|uniref:Uncharacterized protein n=1 Tax=Cuscuta epithymum TaxID=186058 RepID=A0AAV0BYN1_9ASTE|nr:unnamed protein product [Cuscuta epithymum]